MEKKGDALVVVAIDFGTTYSGYAYSFRAENEKDHTKVYSNSDWRSGDGLATTKTPTVILFNEDKQFCKFGYEAEAKYNTLLEDEMAEGWRYFRRFKMRLFRGEEKILERTRVGKITKNLMIEDEQGKPMSALIVFAESIRYLKDQFLLNQQVQGLKFDPNNDIHWVLTVPAIWTDRAKQFIREAAKQAGIPDDMLTLAYEPEAAALYYKELIEQKKEGAESSSSSSLEPGQQFLVLDWGGGTVDVAAYQVQNDGDLRELQRPTGEPWGGTYVDNQYTTFLKKLFGADIWSEFSKENPEDVLEIQRKFEAKKKSVNASADDQTTISFPSSLFAKYQIAKNCSSFEESIKKSEFAKTIKVKKDKLRFDHQLVKAYFRMPIDSIVTHVKEIINESKKKGRDIKTILMVGGFSDSSILSQRIISEFKRRTVICPTEAVNAIVKGAVIFGHNPNLISERISPLTYGISVNTAFNNKVHPAKLKVVYDGKEMCTDIFQPIVQIGHPIRVGKEIFKHTCLPTRVLDTEATIEIYESSSECPMYTIDKGVRRLGDLTVSIPDTSKGKNRPIKVEVSFGYTEIVVCAFEEGTETQTTATFDCLLN
ncbi:heat shock 70 kDa protein 12A-like [Mytilus edulis]|uniref:heat shock 70 kDa protein 12A-like n=1 Tax=Mytilus edulis TaxID=6550 RepID=UPI0039EF77A9